MTTEHRTFRQRSNDEGHICGEFTSLGFRTSEQDRRLSELFLEFMTELNHQLMFFAKNPFNFILNPSGKPKVSKDSFWRIGKLVKNGQFPPKRRQFIFKIKGLRG